MSEKKSYTPSEIERRWQTEWERTQLYRSQVDWSKPKHYALTMLPYPSGNLHIGHWFAMTPSDARARFMRMKGYNVLFPMGFDAFGLPAENAAVTRNIHPAKWTHANIEHMRKQLRSMGAMFDWEREIVSCEPQYYRWTEWFFKQFYTHGLAYRGEGLVNWSPTLQTVLANEQVIDGKDERTGQPVIQKLMTQWFFRYTAYADEMLDFSKLDWPDAVKLMQTNWIGRSEGANVIFKTEHGDDLEVYTTRPDTLWGATFMVLAPEHPLVETLTTPAQREAIEAYKAQTAKATEIERTSESREKTGVFTGGYAINPMTNQPIPVWIADYVMITYGTGAIMAVPSGDQRDFDFARKFGLQIIPVVQPDDQPLLDGETMEVAYDGAGTMINSGALNGIRSTGVKGRKNPAIDKAITILEEMGVGRESVNYRLRDWLISRQRYWGSPIPIIHRADGTTEAVADADLPVTLPENVEFTPEGRSPLTVFEPFLNTHDRDGNPARRETDTMDTFMCSSWYHLRYLSPRYGQAPFDPQEAAYWLPVDVYTGGAEHATMHLLYARWFNKACRDLGVFDDALTVAREHGRTADGLFDEPYMLLRNQGQVLGAERLGDYLLIAGTWDGERIIAEYVEVIEVSIASMPQAEAVWIGELMRRTENILHVKNAEGEERIIEVPEGTYISIPSIPGDNNVNQLKHHLEVQRMSKSRGNVVDPDKLVEQYGSDTVRAYLMFGFDWQKGGPWGEEQIKGVVRWLHDVYDLVVNQSVSGEGTPSANRALERTVHKTIKQVEDSLTAFSFNTAIAALMTLRNELKNASKVGEVGQVTWKDALRQTLLLMAPFTPHLADELWAHMGGAYSIHQQAFPVYDPNKAQDDELDLVVMVNGKLRATLKVEASISQEDATVLALSNESVQRFLNGQAPKKVIFVAGRPGQPEPKVNIVL